MGESDHCYFFGCSNDCKWQVQNTGHRPKVQDAASEKGTFPLIYNSDLFQIVIKVRRHLKCCLFTVAW